MDKKHLTDRKSSLALFALVWVLYAVVYTTQSCYSAAMATIVSNGVMTKSQTGLIASAFYISYAPFQILGGKFADRYRPDVLIFIGLIGAALTNLVIYFTTSYYVMLVSWFFNGMVQFGIWPSIFKIVSSKLDKDFRSRAIFLISFASWAGCGLAFLISAFISDWKSNFFFSSIALCISALVVIFVYPILSKKMVDTVEDENPSDKSEKKPTSLSSVKLFFKCGLFLFLPASLIRSLINVASTNLSPIMLIESYENLSVSMGNILNIFVIASGVAGIFLVKLVYPKFISDEMACCTFFSLVLFPFLFSVIFVGKISFVLVLISLCMCSAITSGMGFVILYYPIRFSKFGKNGEVAGILSAVSSISVLIQTYGLTKLADLFDWKTVYTIIAVSWVFAIIIHIIVLQIWKRFAAKNQL